MGMIQSKYNPKLEYLICKNLLIHLPYGYDEQNLRKCFEERKQAKRKYEKEILKTKSVILSKPLNEYKEKDIEYLYEVITGEKVQLSFIEPIFNQEISFLYKIILVAKGIEESKVKDPILLFKIILIVLTSIEKKEILIPYYKPIKKLYESIQQNELVVIIDILYQTLLYRSKRYNHLHDIQQHPEIINKVKENAKTFVKENNILAFGIYGSFVTGKANEYSDIDLFVMIHDELNEKEIRKKAEEFWYSIIPIDIDFKIVKEREMDKKLTKGMKRTLKIIAKKEMIENV